MTRIWPYGQYTVDLRQHKGERWLLHRGRVLIEVCSAGGGCAPAPPELVGCGKALALAAGVLLGGCGETPVPPVPPPVPVRLVLAAADTLAITGETLTFSATALDSLDAPVPGAVVAWSVSHPFLGQVTGGGMFTAGPGAGVVYVRATVEAAGLAESVAVRVIAPGTVRWTFAAADVGGTMPLIGGVALGLDGTVYAIVETDPLSELAELVALDPDGQLRWTLGLTETKTNYPFIAPSGEIGIVGRRVTLFRPDGTVAWDRAPDAGVIFNGGASTDDLVIAAHGLHVTAFRLATGNSVWQSPLAPFRSWLVPPTAVGTSLVYAKHTRDTLFAFRQSDGTIVHTVVDPDTGVDKAIFGTGTVPVGNRFYLPTWSRLAAFDTAGQLLWLTDEHSRGTTEPAVAPDGTLYLQSRRWGLEALNPDGTTKWFRRTVGSLGGWEESPRWSWYGGPALAEGGIIYAAGREAFFAYDRTGTLLWKFVADSTPGEDFPVGPFIGAPAIAPDGTVYTFTATDIYAFWASAPPEPNSPWPMWRHDAQRTGWAR